ncbi:response regulator [Denitrificimonas caeni]|uniref:response regulator n=1 Tax=Denitrificimonas caeni TaxID=521720 RepID=UPI001962DC6E|nr:response regulator [Denitrificimonas caeni]
MQILVVDDDLLAGEMTTAVLEDLGYKVFQAENAVEAMEVLNQQPDIELIVSDLNMPMISGIEFYRELKEQGSKLPFILLTGDEPEKILAEEPGLDACVMKDFSMQESLPAAIRTVMSASPSCS